MSHKVRLALVGGLTFSVAVGVGYVSATTLIGPKLESLSCTDPDHDHSKTVAGSVVPAAAVPGTVKITETERSEAFERNSSRYDERTLYSSAKTSFFHITILLFFNFFFFFHFAAYTEIGRDEAFMGLNLLRWWQMYKARGDVLEVGCGTGRNFEYYSYGKIKSITAVDVVPGMLRQAKKKVKNSSKVTLSVMNAHALEFPDGKFDTVVDTFGLCSYEDPVAVLVEMARVCKPDGRILLIEHGLGSYDWINNTMDRGAQQHAVNWGCIWNRDINSLVEQAGLRVKSSSRWHFGTTYLIEALPPAHSTESSSSPL